MPEKMIETALISLPVGVVIIDKIGKVLFANPAFRRLTGWSNDALVGKSISLVLSNVDQGSIEDYLSAQWSGNVQCVSPSGTFLNLKLDVEHLLAGEKEAFLLTFHPVSLISHTFKDSNEEDRHRKIEVLGTLSGEVAHDLNNILTGILGHVSFLKLLLSDDGSHVDSLQAIEDSSRKAAKMTKQILEFARGESVVHQVVDLCKVVNDAVSLVKTTLPENIDLKVFCSEDSVLVLGNETQLSQLVMNLTVNARDAVHNGGNLEINLDVIKLHRALIDDTQQLSPGYYARLAIIDSGTGMTEEIRQHIFEPFYTTKAKRGTGLGLAIVFTAVRSHQGLIRVESEVGKGSRFEVYIPLALKRDKDESNADQSQVEGNGAQKIERGSERILIIDDEETVRIVVQKSLEHLGYQVDCATNGREALDNYGDKLDNYDLIILDMMMPLMSGDEVFFKLKEIKSDVVVLIASGYASDLRTKEVLNAGAKSFIQKPFAVDELAAEVRHCLKKA